MLGYDETAVPVTEVVEEYRMPLTKKDRVDLNRVESSMKQAMNEVGYNLKHVKDNPQATKIAQF